MYVCMSVCMYVYIYIYLTCCFDWNNNNNKNKKNNNVYIYTYIYIYIIHIVSFYILLVSSCETWRSDFNCLKLLLANGGCSLEPLATISFTNLSPETHPIDLHWRMECISCDLFRFLFVKCAFEIGTLKSQGCHYFRISKNLYVRDPKLW